jgi:hypothetical protein
VRQVALQAALADAQAMKVLLILSDAPYGTERS